MPRLLLFFCCLCAGWAPAQGTGGVRLLCNWNDTSHIRPTAGYGSRYNDVWGLTWAGREYGVIGSTEGTHVIDIATCQQAAFYPGRAAGPNLIHRDFKTYKNYLYAVCDEGEGSLQVFDYSTLPDSLHLVWESNPLQLMRSHTIFIDTDKARLYCASAVGLANGSDPLRIYSLADPAHPVLTHRIGAAQGVMDLVHALYAKDDTAYLSCSNYGYLVAKVHPTDSIALIGGTISYIDKGYNHSSWVNSAGIGVMADETHGLPMKVIRTRPLPYVEVASTFSPCSGDTCVPHNPYLIGTIAYISHYFQGLVIYDIANPLAPALLGSYDTYPAQATSGFSGAWGCYPFLPSGKVLVSDMQTGLYVLDASQALSTHPVATSPKALTAYPNPATDALHVRWPAASNASLVVLDATGRTVWREVLPQGSTERVLPLPAAWPSGLYLVRIQAADALYTTRFLKTP